MVNLAMDEAHSDGDVFYAGAVTDTDKLNGYSRAINNNTDYHLLHNTSAGGSIKRLTGTIGTANSIAVVSATKYVASYNDTTNVRVADLSGGIWTFTNKAHNLVVAGVGVVACATDPTKLIAWSDTTSAYSADSGATWTVANVEFPNITKIYSMSFPTAALAVAVGNPSSGNAQWICTDFATGSSLNWAQVTTGSASNTHSVHMLSATIGLMSVGTAIWKTEDGDVWTDTTHTGGNDSVGSHIYAKSLTTGILSSWQVGLKNYANANATIVLTGVGTAYKVSNVIPATNGNYYCVVFPDATITDKGTVTLCKSTDDGASWTSKVIGAVDNGWGAPDLLGNNLQELSANLLLFHVGNFACTIDESYTGAE